MMMTTQVTFKGNTMTLKGQEVSQGQQAPDFQLLNSSLQPVTLNEFKGQAVLFNVVPSLDTPVCQIQSRQFYSKLGNQSNVKLVTVSMDLPFAQARFCGAEEMDMMTLSDHRTASFGEAFGLVLPDLRLLTRSVILVDASGKIAYMEVVPEVTSEPNYDAALQAVHQLQGATV
jgi:thioredoxin-dependent peroxiredoxin